MQTQESPKGWEVGRRPECQATVKSSGRPKAGCALGEDGQKNEFRPRRAEPVTFGTQPESPGRPPETSQTCCREVSVAAWGMKGPGKGGLETEGAGAGVGGPNAGQPDLDILQRGTGGWALHLHPVCARWEAALPTVRNYLVPTFPFFLRQVCM